MKRHLAPWKDDFPFGPIESGVHNILYTPTHKSRRQPANAGVRCPFVDQFQNLQIFFQKLALNEHITNKEIL